MITALESTIENDERAEVLKACAKLNHLETETAVAVERQFMKTLEGGCTAPIGGNATISNNSVYFKGVLSALDGSDKIEIEKSVPLNEVANLGSLCAKEMLNNGGFELMKTIKSEMK